MKIKLLTDTATMPTRGSEKAAGWDLYADFADEIYLPPNDVRMIGTGVAVEIPEGYFWSIVCSQWNRFKKRSAPG